MGNQNHFHIVSAIRAIRWLAAGCVCLFGPLTISSGADDIPQDVRRIFEDRCLSCHNSQERAGEFSLETAAALRESGYVEPGDAGASHLLSVLQSEDGQPPRMPKDSTPLSRREQDVLATWIAEGAVWDDSTRLQPPVVDNFDWWSWRPLNRPAVPEFEPGSVEAEWIQSPIDAFVLAEHRRRGLSRSVPADRRQLIRRLTFDLTGLPPAPREIEAFVNDSQPDATARLVERLLESPAYGERWARHWLDVVKYADTHGYDKDKLRPNAWPYRDYVIRSFNEDKPWGQFIQEQIAGDVLYLGTPDGILGLGLLSAGPWDFIGHVEVPETKLDGQVARNLDRDDMVSNVMNAFCSVTIQCARCHNHKFDPMTQDHYYGLQAVFAAVDRADRRYDTDPQSEQKREDLNGRVAELRAQRAAIEQDVVQRGGDVLSAMEKDIASLRGKSGPVVKSAAFGYHSAITDSADSVRWVEVDLGSDVNIAEIVLHPCHDEYAGIGAGFGFPRRYRIECRGESSDAVVRIVADATEHAVPNPGLQAVVVPVTGVSARYVRVTATQLAERSQDFIFSLAELEVKDAAGDNLARGCEVLAADSIEASVRWQRRNLTDGEWAVWQKPDVNQRLHDLTSQRAELRRQLTSVEQTAVAERLDEQIRKLAAELKALPEGRVVFAAATDFAVQGNFKPTGGAAREVRVLHRGEITSPGPTAVPGAIPLTADQDWRFAIPEDAPESARRAALARWIAGPDNPLTWRSAANRIWQYHFGRGLVDSPNDFGRMGQQPTHPELLDWLADELRRTQSVRHLHRLIVLSATYQQSSEGNPAGISVDADNQYLARMSRRRLSAEEVRDAVLWVSGCLNREPGGPGFYLFELERTEHSPHYEYHKFDPADPATHRRSVYRFVVRSQPDPFMTTLDCADSSQSTPRRLETQTALQALSLLNNRFTLEMAERFAARLESASTDRHEQIRTGMRLVTGRDPSGAEVRQLQQFAEQHGLPSVCRVLFNLNEFVYVD